MNERHTFGDHQPQSRKETLHVHHDLAAHEHAVLECDP